MFHNRLHAEHHRGKEGPVIRLTVTRNEIKPYKSNQDVPNPGSGRRRSGRAVHAVAHVLQWHNQRRGGRQISDLSDHVLRDIGLIRAELKYG